jgi:hypothetical protein
MFGIRILSSAVVLVVLIFICCCKEAEAERGRKCEGIVVGNTAMAKKREIIENEGRRTLCKDKLRIKLEQVN